jgi:hypothetical protein
MFCKLEYAYAGISLSREEITCLSSCYGRRNISKYLESWVYIAAHILTKVTRFLYDFS